ncbi:VanW family protein [Paenibacillus solisilvae]|uniref:VanW family protein n=1 Tax=Paenibacillus solisilvae TaxID=2486751 RepID=A0ABW0VX94_9BACL
MKKLHLILIIVVSLLLLSSVIWGFFWIYAARNSIPEGVQLTIQSGSPINQASEPVNKHEMLLKSGASFAFGGLAVQTALQELSQRQERLEHVPLTVQANQTGGQKKTWTLAELGLHVDTKEAAAAILKLQQGGVWEKAKYRLQFPKTLHIEVRWNKQTFLKAITGQWGYLNANEPINATRTITKDDKIIYTPHTDVYRLDTESLFTKSVQAVEAIIAKDWAPAPQGDAGAANKKLSVTLPLAVKLIHPEFTLERLKAQGIERKITSFTTDFSTSGAGRAYNVSMTAKTLNGWELAPGEVFDYSKVITLTSKQYGYRQAPVILNGELVPGIGGGICQVSSTLYNAALLAGLHMVERRNHSLPVSYLPKGQDATFAEGAINFRFKNTTGKSIIIQTEVSGRKLTVKLFGTMPANVSYSIKSKTIATIEPPVKEIPTSMVQPGERLLLSLGRSGYIVETYRTLMKNGKEISSERISRDTYKAQPTVYGISPGSGAPKGGIPKGEKLLEDGVAE